MESGGDHFTIDKTVVLVRDVRAIMASYHEAVRVRGLRWSKRADRHAEYCRRTSLQLMELASWPANRVRFVWYDGLVTEPQLRKDLADWLEWPLQGDPAHYQKRRHGHRGSRGYEVQRHHGIVSGASVILRQRYADTEQQRWAEIGTRTCVEYQRFFGFE